MQAFFVTGTDTGVGKTLATVALLVAARSRGRRCIGIKPVAAGARLHEGHAVNDDALALQSAASVRLDYPDVNPVLLGRAMAPHLAAAGEGRRLGVEPLAGHCRMIAALEADFLLAEGAGGWLVPLNDRETMADLAVALGWPVVLVVGMRLGCLNHALLTAESIRARGLRLAGWIANSTLPEMAGFEGNVVTLDDRLGAPRLGIVPWLGQSPDPARAAAHVDFDLLAAEGKR